MNAAALASAKDGEEAVAGVKMKERAARPRTSVNGRRVIGVEL